MLGKVAITFLVYGTGFLLAKFFGAGALLAVGVGIGLAAAYVGLVSRNWD